MKKTLKTALLAGTLAASLLLAACGGSPASQPAASAPPASGGQSASAPASTGANATLRVGASPAPHAEILEQVKPILEEQGITLEIIEFSDYVLPNIALNDGDIDANYFQHKPYLDDFNAENNMELASAAAIHFEPLGIYPGRTASVEELADGALIGIPNDTTNEARALQLLEAQGLIKLREGVGLQAVPADIEENPHNFEFLELEAAQLPASLPDLDIAVINGNYAVGAGLGDTVLVTEDKGSEAAGTYANIVAVRPGDESRPEIQALVAALQSEAVRSFIETRYNGVVLTVF